MTKTSGKKRLSPQDRVIALCGSCMQIVAQGTRSRADDEVLIRALQAYKEGTLVHVFTRPTELPEKVQLHQLFSLRFEDLAFLAPKLQKYLRQRDILYIGEVYYVIFDRRSIQAVRFGNEIFNALESQLGLPHEFDPLLDGWTPPYWSDPSFRQTLSTPVIEVLGDQPTPRHWPKLIGYTSEARLIHGRGIHYIGAWLQSQRVPTNELGSPTSAWSVGKLMYLQSTLSHVPNLWAAALIPSDWQAPEGVPEVWTRVYEDEIVPAIKEKQGRQARIQERKEALNQWKQLEDQALEAYLQGKPVQIAPEHGSYLNQPIVNFLLWAYDNDAEVASRLASELENHGARTIGQLIQLTNDEFNDLLKQAFYPGNVSESWWRHTLNEWLYDNGRLLRPVVLPEEQRDQHPIPQIVIDYRERRKVQMAEASTPGDQLVATKFEILCELIDVLELSVLAHGCLQNAGIYYVWQLCQCTEAKLRSIKNCGRKSFNEIKEILEENGLELGLVFSPESLRLLTKR